VKRKCKLLIESKAGDRAIYIDLLNSKSLLEFINQNNRYKKKFLFITDLILSGIRNSEFYDREEINNNCKGVTAMKFFKGQENARIYCKEIKSEDKVFVIVIVKVLERKKSQKLDKKLICLLETIGSYQYEIIR